PDFDERYIRDEADWASRLYPQLKAFLLRAVDETDRPRLVLDAHVTLAFAAGSVLNTKIGRIIELEQRTPARQIWASDDAEPDPSWPAMAFEEIIIDAARPELAVAVAATHAIGRDVQAYIAASLPSVGRLLVATPTAGPGQASVRGGRHASDLAATIAAQTKSHGSATPGATTHLFMAGPNALSFYLG